MNKRFKDDVSVPNSTLMHRSTHELKNIKVAVRRKDVLETNHSGPLQRDLQNPDELVVHRRASRSTGEGQRPIFSREDIVVNQEFETRVFVTSPARPSTSRASERLEPRRSRSYSPTRYRSTPDAKSTYSKERRRSRSLSPQGKRYKKDNEKTVTSKKDRSPSPYSRRRDQYVSKERKRSTSPDDRSKYHKYKSPPRRSRTPHRTEGYRRLSELERHRRRSSSQHEHDDSYRHRRSRSPYRSSRFRRSRSPYSSERHRTSKFDRKSRSPHSESRFRDYRKRSRSPHRYDGYRGSPKRYSRSPSHRDRGYREFDRSRRRTPSPYRDSRRVDVRSKYDVIPPSVGHPGMNFLRAPWYGPMYGPWRDPIRPELIPPHVMIRPHAPGFYPAPFPIMDPTRPPRPPIVYNNRNTNFAQIKKATTSTVTSSTIVASTSIATSSTVNVEDSQEGERVVDSQATLKDTEKTSSSEVEIVPKQEGN